MYPLVCASMFILGMVLNYLGGDKRMLALCFAVGASANLYYLTPQQSPEMYYAFCISVDAAVCLVAWRLKAPASGAISFLCVLLVIAHMMAWALDGTPPLSPYRLIVKLLEFFQLAACVALSPVIAPFVRSRHVETTE